MSTFDRVDVDDVTFDVSKLSITTTPPGQHSNHQPTNQSKSDDQSNNQSKSDDPGFNIILESAEYDDHSKHQSISKSDRRQPNGHTSTDVKRAHPEEASPSNNDDLEPKEHSASSQHNNQLTKQSQHNNQPTNQPTNHSSEHSTKQSESQSHSRKPSEPVNDIEAAKAKAHAERVAKKAAKLARKAEKLTKDDSSLKPVRKDQNFTVSASAPNSPVDSQHSSPVQVTHTLSKHKLLAPPPIKSSRNNLVNAADGSASPMSPPSPYVSPTHPKRKNQPHPNTSENRIFGFDWVNVLDRALEMVFGRNVTDIRSMAPKTLIRHPYVVATIFSFSAMLLVLKSFGIRMMTPLFLISWLLTWLIHHWHVTVSLLGSLTVAWAVKNRDSVVRMYRAVFLPPLTDSFPDCFEYEEIQLADQPKELVLKWAKEIDQYTPIEDLIHQPNNQFDPSDSSPTAQNRDTLPQMYSRMSGTAALSLMQCYQQGDLEDCEFHCLRVYSKDASFIANSVKESRNNNIEQDNDDTMGFVFISIKKHYDVSPTLLKIFTPIQVCFPWLCLPALWSQRIRRMMTFRFGVVGFHWPFRSAVFFTKPVEDFKSILELDTNAMAHLADAEQATEHNESMIIQVARTAAFIAVAKRFDTSRPVSERCDFVLYTVATASPVVNSILASGGAPLPILPTYVADLRPVKGQDWQAYKRYLRHQNRKVREGPFENAGGHADLVAGKNMSDEDADTLVEMWHKVAGFRSSRDATSCLMAPTVKFIHELTHNPSGIVNFLALKLNQTVVAASLLFSLGPEVLTSDVAGFNYDALEEAGRKANQQIKAYPVKLAAVIKHGIANGFEYVDFGPTTGPSKMELGCREIALTGGLYYHGTITSIVVSLAACAATSRHTSAGR